MIECAAHNIFIKGAALFRIYPPSGLKLTKDPVQKYKSQINNTEVNKFISNQVTIYTFLEKQQISHTFSYREAVSYVVSNTKYNSHLY